MDGKWTNWLHSGWTGGKLTKKKGRVLSGSFCDDGLKWRFFLFQDSLLFLGRSSQQRSSLRSLLLIAPKLIPRLFLSVTLAPTYQHHHAIIVPPLTFFLPFANSLPRGSSCEVLKSTPWCDWRRLRGRKSQLLWKKASPELPRIRVFSMEEKG